MKIRNTNYILFLFFLFTINVTAQEDIALKVKKLELKIDSLHNSVSKLKENDNSLYSLQKDIISVKKEVKGEYESWWRDVLKVIGYLSAILGGVLAFFAMKSKIKDIVIEKIAVLVNQDSKDIGDIINNKLINKKLRKENRFFILNEKDSVFTEGFKEVMHLFHVDTNDNKNLANIIGLQNITPELIKKIRNNYDILIIENQAIEDKALWSLPVSKNKVLKDITNFRKQKTETEEKIKKLKNSKELEIGTQKNELNKLNEVLSETIESLKIKEVQRDNCQALINLADKICGFVSIVYYGQAGKGNFPSEEIKSEYQHKITFANAPAQLYGNINNQLQFIYEVEKKNSKQAL